MSAYPLVDDLDALTVLDDWVVDKVWLAVRRRRQLLEAAGLRGFPPPYGVTRAELRSLNVISLTTGNTIDLSIPSLRRIAGVISSAARRYGPSRIGQQQVY